MNQQYLCRRAWPIGSTIYTHRAGKLGPPLRGQYQELESSRGCLCHRRVILGLQKLPLIVQDFDLTSFIAFKLYS
uniref:Uncharacterized protein n=1 Tax=Trichogramma kaykai TaxID=54128 RepID=A0ABD2X5A3_9HYME